jgi:periplasmic protein TonB
MGPATRGATALGRSARVTKGKVDADWLNDLHSWWLRHGYYPEQAAMAGEDGTVEIQVVVDRHGRVRTVDLEGRSGSQWLDMAAQAVFRGANLPPFPPGTPNDEVTLDLRINYMLVRR